MGEQQALKVVQDATGLSEGEARVLIGLVLAAYKHRSLEAECDLLRSALQPFAEYAAMFDHNRSDIDFATGVVMLSDLRAAREALSEGGTP